MPWSALTPHSSVVGNLLAGSLVGAWAGAAWATRMRSATQYRVLAGLLALIAGTLIANHVSTLRHVDLAPALVVAGGVMAGFCIGVVAALMGVAGGELLMPTIVLLFGIDITIAGSLSLAVSLPTMIVAFARYSRDGSPREREVLALMADSSSCAGMPGLSSCSLLLSSVKVWRHATAD